MLDTFHEVEAPEGVSFRLRIAGPVVRALAWTIDLLIRGVFYFVLLIVLSLLGDFGMGLLMIVFFVAEWLYPVLFEVYHHGATPGKSMFGLAVVHDDGTPVGWAASLVRNLLRFVDFMPLLYGFGLASVLMRRDHKRLGDITAGTRVVYRGRAPALGGAPLDAEPAAPVLVLQLDEQRALIDFAGRVNQMSQARAQELATIAAPHVARSSRDDVTSVVGVANWLLGKRA